MGLNDLNEIETWIESVDRQAATQVPLANELYVIGLDETADVTPLICYVAAKKDVVRAVSTLAEVLTRRCVTDFETGIELFGRISSRSRKCYVRSSTIGSSRFLLLGSGEAGSASLELARKAKIGDEVETLRPLGGVWRELSGEVFVENRFNDPEAFFLRDAGVTGILLGLCMGAVSDTQNTCEANDVSVVQRELRTLLTRAAELEDLFLSASSASIDRQARMIKSRAITLKEAPGLVSRAIDIMGSAGCMRDNAVARRFEQVHLLLALMGPA